MIKKFDNWLSESLVGEDWPFGMAIYKSIEADQKIGTRKVHWISSDGKPYDSEIEVRETKDPEVFDVRNGMAGYTHNYTIVILGHGIYQKLETARDREKYPRQYRDYIKVLPEKFKQFLNPYTPECPRKIEEDIRREVKRMEKFVVKWGDMSDDDIEMFTENPEFVMKFLRSGLELEEWKEKAKGVISGKKFSV